MREKQGKIFNSLDRNEFISVSALNRYIKSVFDSDFRLKELFLKGEISNLVDHYSSGHIYFTLKEGGSAVKAVMFKTYASNLHFEPKNGMEVIVRCSVSLYEKDGTYQIYAYEMENFGAGKLYAEYKKLAEKLQAKGLFDEQFKKPIPQYPENIAVITSPVGAALQDIINILKRRYPAVGVTIFPVKVQGNGSSEEIINALSLADSGRFDTIIIARGGGSIEDLWEFNSESLAEKIFSCKTPIISAVGHETDITICDMVSDLRAPTPSAGAELAVPNLEDVLFGISSLENKITASYKNKITAMKNKLEYFEEKLSPTRIESNLVSQTQYISSLGANIEKKLDFIKNNKKKQLLAICGLIEQKNPVNILTKGYSLCYKENSLIKSTKNIENGDNIKIRFHDGEVMAVVKKTKANN
ncbi:MAG: exodeoxyribonuclease VII large subunit [Oscillospiraceae bacterium]